MNHLLLCGVLLLLATIAISACDRRATGSRPRNVLTSKGWRFEGEWGISNRVLVATLTNASFWGNYTNDFARGAKKFWRIAQLNAEELVFEDQGVERGMETQELTSNHQPAPDAAILSRLLPKHYCRGPGEADR